MQMQWRMLMVTVLLAGFAGSLLVSWLGPSVLAWYFAPPVDAGINCRPAAEWAMSQLLKAQGIGLAVGFFVGVFVAFKWGRKKPQAEAGVLTADPK